MIAVLVALGLISVGLYQAYVKKTPVLAGVMLPVLIMVVYGAWVVYSAKRHKQKMLRVCMINPNIPHNF